MKNEKLFLKKIKPEMTDCRVMQIEKFKEDTKNNHDKNSQTQTTTVKLKK